MAARRPALVVTAVVPAAPTRAAVLIVNDLDAGPLAAYGGVAATSPTRLGCLIATFPRPAHHRQDQPQG
jgi:hypothetical protein